MHIEEFLSHFSNVKAAGQNQWRACCPSHEDSTPSLGITTKEGNIAVNCLAGCDSKSILNAVGLTEKDFYPPQEPYQPPPITIPIINTTIYYYQNLSGVVVAQIHRYDLENGKKDIRQYNCITQKWEAASVPRPLYRLPALVDSSEVWIGEGEKVADALTSIGLVGTTAMGGAGAPTKKTDWSPLAGRNVVICPDRDAAGRKYAQNVAIAALAAGAKSVHTVQLPDGQDDGWDVADAIRDGTQLKDILGWPRSIFKPNDQVVAPTAVMQLEPEPLRGVELERSEYPVQALGEILGDAVLALEHLVKAPVDLCAQAILASSSLAVQQHFDVLLPWGKTAPTSLMMITVVDSGGRKSEVFDVVTKAAKDQEKAEMATYERASQKFNIAADIWKQAVEHAKSTNKKRGVDAVRQAVDAVGPSPAAPIAPARFVTDPTVEGLFKLMERSQPSVALFTDEAGSLVGGHAMNADNFMKTISKLSKFWDGGTLDRIRAGDAVSILYGRRLCVHLSAQPSVMKKLLNDPLANNQGFLARCLTVWPAVDWGNRIIDKFESPYINSYIQCLSERLRSLMQAKTKTAADNPQELAPTLLTLDFEAQNLALYLVNDVERKQANHGSFSQIRDRASKAVEQMIRVAGVIIGIEHGLEARIINVATLKRASVLVYWYLEEILRIRTFAEVPEVVTNAEVLLNWLKEKNITQFGTKKVITFGPLIMRNKTVLQTVIHELLSLGYIRVLPPGTKIDGVAPRKAWELC